ncbi:DUF2069 domain-containing protein [Photobacterium lutimaris]|uniref:DUF2069 domain-containing protein n=1 Tax=Photobacterium lutimaris TaxID=388278 RepID=A0A2T3IUW0_9GAMM|nr:DUF2069 domain-containing protein [Photobacterium lutimaris]PSU32192.1 DUF2069 domain-containing protein [Photobacterium lutimaris]TDR70513.1 putative membrane protein [Photobacterium lutimaris]
MTVMQKKTRLLRYFAVSANLGLLAWVILWQASLSPHPHINPMAMAAVWALPLLLPLKGILAGKPYTHAWANFILMFYFLHALTILWVDDGERWLALVELALTTSAFIANILFARHRGRELGLKLKKLSQVEKEEKAQHEGR